MIIVSVGDNCLGYTLNMATMFPLANTYFSYLPTEIRLLLQEYIHSTNEVSAAVVESEIKVWIEYPVLHDSHLYFTIRDTLEEWNKFLNGTLSTVGDPKQGCTITTVVGHRLFIGSLHPVGGLNIGSWSATLLIRDISRAIRNVVDT